MLELGLELIEIAANFHLLEALPHRFEIEGDDRHGVGIDHGRTETIILADARCQYRRQGDRHAGPALAQQIADFLFVGGVGIGVHKADRDGLDVFRLEPVDGPFHPGPIEGLADASVAGRRFGDLQAPGPRDKGAGLIDEGITDRGSRTVPDLENVAESLGRDQSRLRPFAFDEGVDDHRRAVDDDRAVGHRHARILDQSKGADRWVFGRRQALVVDNLTRVLVDDGEVGEGATDVNADPKDHETSSFPLRSGDPIRSSGTCGAGARYSEAGTCFPPP